MTNYYWNDWYSGWGWMLWLGFIVLMISGMGNWGYTYQAHRRYRDLTQDKDAIDLLSERYAKGEIEREEFVSMREEIFSAMNAHAQNKNNIAKKISSPMTPSMRAT